MPARLCLTFAGLYAALLLSNGCRPSGDTQTPLVLTDTSLGPLSLSPTSLVSVDHLRQMFPAHHVTHGVRSGDSPDFHFFEVKAADGEVLFTMSSFLEQDRPVPDASSVPIHLLKVLSPRVVDAHGIRVGDRVADIVRARGDNLEFGGSHFHVYLGADRIFYNIRTSGESSPDRLTLADAVRENWSVISMSWPRPAWE